MMYDFIFIVSSGPVSFIFFVGQFELFILGRKERKGKLLFWDLERYSVYVCQDVLVQVTVDWIREDFLGRYLCLFCKEILLRNFLRICKYFRTFHKKAPNIGRFCSIF